MTFLQPGLVYALPLAALPVLIHLLNRLRYRTVPWAATMFLISATRASTRRARLRQILILIARTLAFLFLIAAVSRPLAGGWLGMAAGSSLDTVLVLVDRSASMETTEARLRTSRRSRALSLIAQAAGLMGRSPRFVLIDSVGRTPRELASLDGMAALASVAPSDTAADIPALLSAAADYAARNRTGRTEIWLASDLQASNWRPASRDWARVNGQLGALPQPVSLRLLAMDGEAPPNVAVSIKDIRRTTAGGKSRVAVSVRILRSSPDTDRLPVTVTLNGIRTQVAVPVSNQEMIWTRVLDPGLDGADGGWGKIEVPADGNAQDNACYFVYGPAGALPSVVVAESRETGRFLRLAAAADGEAAPRDLLTPATAGTAPWDTAVAVQWQGELPSASASGAVTQLVTSGGALMCYPPDRAAAGWFGLQWGDAEAAAPSAPFRVTTWDENDGLLAKTDSGENLPVEALSVLRRRRMTATGPDAAAWHTVASFADGTPLLIERRVGAGRVFACATRPGEDWSTLGDGLVLVPMTQRVLAYGARRRSDTVQAECGEWQPAAQAGPCVALDDAAGRDPARNAGVYRCGAWRAAVNRVPSVSVCERFLPGAGRPDRWPGQIPARAAAVVW